MFKYLKKHNFSLIILVVTLVIILVGLFVKQKTEHHSPQDQITYCKNLGLPYKIQCWEKIMDNTISQNGIAAAFDLLSQLSDSDPSFTPSCHDFAHRIGIRAYQLFSDNVQFNLSPKISYCGFGFYHGFMEELLHKTGDASKARRFCEYTDSQLKNQVTGAIGYCFHGIGHGAVDGSDPTAWGNPQAMIEPAIKLCQLVSNDENPTPRYGKFYRCSAGVFNALQLLVSANKYKLSLNTSDPFKICKIQPDNLKEACYTQFVGGLFQITNPDFQQAANFISGIKENQDASPAGRPLGKVQVTNYDFQQAANFISGIKEDQYALPAIRSLVVERVRFGKTDYKDSLSYCRNLGERFHITCVIAFDKGFIKYGPPQQEYIEALKFCDSNLLTEQEKQACFANILPYLTDWGYTSSRLQSVCKLIDPKYRQQDCLHY